MPLIDASTPSLTPEAVLANESVDSSESFLTSFASPAPRQDVAPCLVLLVNGLWEFGGQHAASSDCVLGLAVGTLV